MTTYNTRTLAQEIIGDEGKAATRTLRKFLRDHPTISGVGKGGRYSLDFNKTQLRKLTKEFQAWEVKQAEDKAAREALRAAQEAPKADEVDEAPEVDDTPAEDIEGPSNEDLANMLAEIEDEDED